MSIITYPFGSNAKWGTIKQKNSHTRKTDQHQNSSSVPEHPANLMKDIEKLINQENIKCGESLEGRGDAFIPNSKLLDLRRRRIKDSKILLHQKNKKMRISSYNNIHNKNASNEHLRNSSLQRNKGMRRRKSETNMRKYENLKFQGNFRKISEFTDEQLVMELQKKYNTGLISPIKQSDKKVLNFQSLLQIMQETKLSKQTQIEVLSVYKDELQLIFCLRQAISQPKSQNPEEHRKISLSCLKSKSKIHQQIRRKTLEAQNFFQQLSEQSDIYNKYLMYISEEMQKCRQFSQNDCLLDLKEEKEIMENNLTNEIEFIKKQLDCRKNNNLKEVRKLERVITGLRVQIKKKEQKLKQLNNRIFHVYTRRNTRSVEKKSKMGKVLILSNKLQSENLHELRDDEFFNKLKKDQENRKKLQALAFQKNKINYDQFTLKQLIFTQQNKTLYLQYLYEVSKKEILTQPLMIKMYETDLAKDNHKTVISLGNPKLKSLIFYFDQNTSVFKGLEAKYSQFTHSYDIGRESQIVRVGICQQKDFKYQLPCKDKEFSEFNLLKTEDSDKIYGFAVYFNKHKQENAISKLPTRRNSIASQNSDNSDSCGRISIQSKSKLHSNSNSSDRGTKIILSRKNKPTNRIGTLCKNQPEKLGEAYTEYCLHK